MLSELIFYMDAGLKGKVLSSRVYPEFFPIGGDEAVLHAGCGEGAQLAAYGRSGKRIVASDIQPERVDHALSVARECGISGVEGVVADLERLPFADGTFNKIVAVDIIQHVQNPGKVLGEFLRVLKPGGEALVTFPALQHYLLTAYGRYKRGKTKAAAWHPDAFNHNLSLSHWLRIGGHSGLKLVRSHATTLWPPLHRYGIPRFWFSNSLVHRIDYFFGGLPGIRNCGQALMCAYMRAPDA